MIGILIITHGTFGESLAQNAMHILNQRPEQLVSLGVSAQDDPLELLPMAKHFLSIADQGDGAVLLTDIYGASPANLAAKLLDPGRIEGISGLNLPMLLRVLSYRKEGMEVLLSKAIGGACDGIFQMSQ